MPPEAGQELPPADAELFARLVGEFFNPRFDPFLFLGLRHRHVFAIRDHPRRHGRAERLRDIRTLAFGHLLRVEQSVVLFPDATRFVPFFNRHVFFLLLRCCAPSRGSVQTFAASGTSDLATKSALQKKRPKDFADGSPFRSISQVLLLLLSCWPDRRQETPREATKHYRKSIDARCFQPGDDGWNLLGSHSEGVDRHVFADSSVLPVTFTL